MALVPGGRGPPREVGGHPAERPQGQQAGFVGRQQVYARKFFKAIFALSVRLLCAPSATVNR